MHKEVEESNMKMKELERLQKEAKHIPNDAVATLQSERKETKKERSKATNLRAEFGNVCKETVKVSQRPKAG